MLDVNDPKLTAYLLGELDEAARADIEHQIAASPELQHTVDELRQTIDLISGSLEREPSTRLTTAQRDSLVAGSADCSALDEDHRPTPRVVRATERRLSVILTASLLLALLSLTAIWSISANRESLVVAEKGPLANRIDEDPRVANQQELAVVVEQFNRLVDENRYAEADVLARQAYELSPQEPVVQNMIVISRFARRVQRSLDMADPSQSRYLEALSSVEESGIPFDDSTSMTYPDVAAWKQLSVTRQRYLDPGQLLPLPVDATATEDPYPSDQIEISPARTALGELGEQTSPSSERVGQFGGDGLEGSGSAMRNIRPGDPSTEPGVGDRAGDVDEFVREGRVLGSNNGETAILAGKSASEFESTPLDARRRQRFDAEGALDELKLTLESVDQSVDLPTEARAKLRAQLEKAIIETSELRIKQGQANELHKVGLDKLTEVLGVENEKKSTNVVPQRTWRRVNATPNTSRLMVGDRDELPFEGMQANVVIDGFRARVLLDCYFYNNHDRQLEGTFKIRLPDGASLYYFAFGKTAFEYRPMVDQLASNGFIPADVLRASGTGPAEILKSRGESWADVREARVVPKAKAAHAYSEVVRRRVDPALVEWAGAGVFNASVFPLMPKQLHRIVIGYDVNLQQNGEDLVYKLELPEDLRQSSIDLNVAALPGSKATIEPAVKPFTSGGRAYYHFDNLAQGSLAVRIANAGAMILTGNDGRTGDYFATRITPNLPGGEATANSDHAIFLVDTSLSSNPDKFNVWLKLLAATLNNNRDTLKQFAVLFFDVDSHWWRERFSSNTPENIAKLTSYCQSLSLEGATDLGQALGNAMSPAWADGVERAMQRPDVFLLSDGAVTWGEDSLHLLAKKLRAGWQGTLFAYRTGLSGTADGVLQHLTRESGGAVFSIVNEDEVDQASTAHRTRPWQLIDTTVTGGSDILLAGRNRSIFAGQSLLLVGRGTPSGEIVLQMKQGDERQTIRVPADRVVNSELAPRLYGQVAVGQLEDLMSATDDVSPHFARHFRVSGRTCSLLMLESEEDYQRFDIKPEDDQAVVKSVAAGELIERKLDEFYSLLENPKEEMLAWLGKLERVPGMKFELSTLLRLALETMPRESFEVELPPLRCKSHGQDAISQEYLKLLLNERLDYDAVGREASRRLDRIGSEDALRVLSSLIENRPGDLVLARDVAFSAIEWGHGGQALGLLRRVAQSRPYEPQNYQALGMCLSEIGYVDLALVHYEIAWSGTWNDRYPDFNRIVGVDYLHLLRRIDRGELTTSVPQFVEARLSSLESSLGIGNPDLVITMMWNTDRTDVDLHVVEPSGAECYYENPRIKGGGSLTADVTQGFGPEMYLLPSGQHGKYQIKAKYYSSDTNRTQLRTKVYLTVIKGFGTEREKLLRKTISLTDADEKLDVLTVTVEQ